MKLSELKAIGEKRTNGEWVCHKPLQGMIATIIPNFYNSMGIGEIYSPDDQKFTVCAANHWDKLIAVAEAVKKIAEQEPHNDWAERLIEDLEK